MEKGRATIKRASNKKLSPAKAQKEREKNLSLDISNFLEPTLKDQDFQVPIVSEKEFKRIFEQKSSLSLQQDNHSLKTHLVKAFLTQDQYLKLLKLTQKYNQNKDKNQIIDVGDYLSLIFELISNFDANGASDSKEALIQQLKSIM